MLRAIISKVRECMPDADLAIARQTIDPYIKRAKWGLYQKIWLKRYNIRWGTLEV